MIRIQHSVLKHSVALFLVGMLSIHAAESLPSVMKMGEQAPAFHLLGVDAKTHALDDFKTAKILVVIFTSNHCPEARAAAPRMAALDAKYRDRGVAFVAISGNHPDALRPDELGYSPYGDSLDEMKLFAAEYGWKFPYLYDADTQEVTTAYGAQATPHVFIFDEKRVLRYNGRMDDAGRKSGDVDKSYVVDAIEALLAGREIETETTRAVGCSTKWLFKREAAKKDQESWERLPVRLDVLDAKMAKKLRENTTDQLRVINLWSTACGSCVAEFLMLVDTHRRFQNRPVEVITISLDPASDFDKVGKFLQSRNAALSPRTAKSVKEDGRSSNNYLFQGNPDELADAIDPQWSGALPLTLVIAPGGKLLWRNNDEVEGLELRRQIVKWLDTL